MKERKVSVVIAVFNRKDLMEKTAASILGSDYKNYELIIVDGGSSDGTLDMLRSCARKNRKLKVYLDKRPGRNAARNTGIARARGEIIIFVDSDCIVDRDWMREIVRPFKDQSVGGVIGKTIADRKGLFWYHMENEYLQFVGHNNAYRMKIIKELGGFDKRFVTAKEDTDLAWRVIEAGHRVVYCPKARMTHISKRVSVRYRIQNQNTFFFEALLYKKHRKLYKKYAFQMGMPAPLWPSFLSVPLLAVFAYSLAYNTAAAAAIAAVYAAAALFQLLKDKDGTIKEKAEFLLLAWMIPLSRTYHFLKGYLRFWRAS